ncbi:pyrroline-5-carboxylate reductase [Peptoniphilus sp. ING2-D1G]|nr:pyrroline-5-carboxylate reductase [Peptoniphilus sp. ING2-D1G]
MENIGIIGIGNMGGAILRALIKSDFNVVIANRTSEKLKEYGKYKNVEIADSNISLVKKCKYVILAVKPNMYESVGREITSALKDESVIISIAASFDKDKLKGIFKDVKTVLSMPNTPAMVSEGMSAVCFDEILNEQEREDVLEIFESFGRVAVLEEKDFAAFGAVCGALPAYVYMFIEACCDAAVLEGMSRKDSYEFIAQTVLGSAKMVIESKKHPAELKDMVTSPGGTTIEGLKVLEDLNFRSAIINAIDAATQKYKRM